MSDIFGSLPDYVVGRPNHDPVKDALKLVGDGEPLPWSYRDDLHGLFRRPQR